MVSPPWTTRQDRCGRVGPRAASRLAILRMLRADRRAKEAVEDRHQRHHERHELLHVAGSTWDDASTQARRSSAASSFERPANETYLPRASVLVDTQADAQEKVGTGRQAVGTQVRSPAAREGLSPWLAARRPGKQARSPRVEYARGVDDAAARSERANQRRKSWVGGVAHSFAEMEERDLELWMAATPGGRVRGVTQLLHEMLIPGGACGSGARLQRAVGGVRPLRG